MTDKEIFEIITRVENVQEDLLEEDTERSNFISIKEAIEGLDTVVDFFGSLTEASESIETDLDNLVEVRKRLESIRERNKIQPKKFKILRFNLN